MSQRTRARDKRRVVLRLEPEMVDAIQEWAEEELRSANSQMEHMLRRVLIEEKRMSSSGSAPRTTRRRS